MFPRKTGARWTLRQSNVLLLDKKKEWKYISFGILHQGEQCIVEMWSSENSKGSLSLM
jgi:hypothetical protein